MPIRNPMTQLPTHEVQNQPPALENVNVYDGDTVLREAVRREGGAGSEPVLRAMGEVAGSARLIQLGHDANRHTPTLRTFDRYGHRIDEVEFHPAYHELLGTAIEHGIHSAAWTQPEGGHVTHAALGYLFTQAEAGVMCPIAMTYAVVPSLRRQPELAAQWEPKITAREYDGRCVPAEEKTGVTIGMAMTEKQGGSDVRANTTRARPLGAGGPGGEYELHGHKWFCSAPMSDAFLTLAHTDKGLSCFLVPRWRPDGTRNPFFIQRLKDKLGNRSNASSEIEYSGTWGQMVGEEGRGVPAIIDMVHHTRLAAAVAPASMMRLAFAQAAHHAAHRRAFGKLLIDQPLMLNVLADLAIELEAATVLAMRVARSFDERESDPAAAGFGRIATAVTKYWLNKRAPDYVYEALECHGGAGYVEESVMPRLYREAPLNSIWEGSGNVICLDVLRAMHRQPDTVEIVLAEIGKARGGDRHLDRVLDGLEDDFAHPDRLEPRARRLTQTLAQALQGSLLVQHAPAEVADAFCASRLGGDWGRAYGTLDPGVPFRSIVERARIPVAN